MTALHFYACCDVNIGLCLWDIHSSCYLSVLLIVQQIREGGGWALKTRVNHTGWITVVTPTDRPKSARNRCVIERICSVVV